MNNVTPDAPRAVLLIAKSFPPTAGGVETYSEFVAKEYLRLGYVVDVVTQIEAPAGLFSRDYDVGRANIVNLGEGSQFIVLLKLLRTLNSLFRKKQYTITHATTWRPSIALLPWFKRSKVVISIHGREVMNYPMFLGPFMNKVLNAANTVVTVSDATMTVALDSVNSSRHRGEWITAFNGITYPEIARSHNKIHYEGERSLKILSFARHVPRKNIQGCIIALGNIYKDHGISFRYTIAGKGPMHLELKALAMKCGIDHLTDFIGYVDEKDIPALYADSDIFLHPQTNVGEGRDFEGFGIVIADAMSFGCAVLAGDAGGPKDFIQDGSNGLIVNGLDQNELDDKIISLLTDHTLRKHLSDNGKDYALSKLSWSNHVKMILNSLNK